MTKYPLFFKFLICLQCLILCIAIYACKEACIGTCHTGNFSLNKVVNEQNVEILFTFFFSGKFFPVSINLIEIVFGLL